MSYGYGQLTESEAPMRDVLHSLFLLRRDDALPADQIHTRGIFEALTSRGCVYHRSGGPPVARLPSRKFTPIFEWRVIHCIALEDDAPVEEAFPPHEWPHISIKDDEPSNDFTQCDLLCVLFSIN
jgi:hypothetical protein